MQFLSKVASMRRLVSNDSYSIRKIYLNYNYKCMVRNRWNHYAAPDNFILSMHCRPRHQPNRRRHLLASECSACTTIPCSQRCVSIAQVFRMTCDFILCRKIFYSESYRRTMSVIIIIFFSFNGILDLLHLNMIYSISNKRLNFLFCGMNLLQLDDICGYGNLLSATVQ